MEFYADDKVIVNPLRIKQQYLFELENNLLLYYTSTSRESAKIIEKQSQNVVNKKEKPINLATIGTMLMSGLLGLLYLFFVFHRRGPYYAADGLFFAFLFSLFLIYVCVKFG